MKLDVATITALVSALVAVGGTIVAWFGRNKDSVDKRIELVFGANQALVDDIRTEREDIRAEALALRGRIEDLETDRDNLNKEVRHLRSMLTEQSNELVLLRSREAELRQWSIEIMLWVGQAILMIRSGGGVISEPPAPPMGAPRPATP